MNDTIGSAEQITKKFSKGLMKKAKTTGILMVGIGILGILAPNFISLTLNGFVGGLFLLAAIALAHSAWQN